MTSAGPALITGGIAAVALIGGFMAFSRYADRKAERLSPALGAFSDIDGARFHYLDRGSGSPIVLIHGLGAQMRNFSYALLDRLAETHRVILIDRPGSGYSAAAVHLGIIDQAAAVAGLLDALGVRRPLIVGHSFGGAVALALGLNFPERVSGLALLAPLTQPHDGIPELLAGPLARAHGFRRLATRTIAVPIAKLLARWFRANAFAPDPVPADFSVAGGMALAVRSSSLAAMAFEVATINRDLRQLVPRYADLVPPARILFARGDQVLNPDIHGVRLASANPAIALDLIDGGHMFPVVAPDITAAWIRARLHPTSKDVSLS